MTIQPRVLDFVPRRLGHETRAFVERHAVACYYVLAFTISWGGVLAWAGGLAGMPGTSDRIARSLGLVYTLLGVGAPIAGLLMTAVVTGTAGLRDLATRLARPVRLQWVVAALVGAPLLCLALDIALSLTPAVLAAESAFAVVASGLALGFGAALFEELGWTGFAVPRLLSRHSVLTTGLIAGFLWGAWHLIAFVWSSGDAAGAFSLSAFLPKLISAMALLPAYRVLMVWAYDRTGSPLIAVLMHASLTSSSQILAPLPSGLSAFGVSEAVLMWVAVAAIALADRRRVVTKR